MDKFEEYYLANKDRIDEACKTQKQRNKEKIEEKYKLKREKQREYNRKYRLKKKEDK